MARRRRPAQRSPEATKYVRWYHTAGWRALRDRQLRREPHCLMCAQIGRVTQATVADHIVPHRGDRALFFDASNLQSLCLPHHTEKTTRAERGAVSRIARDADGW